MHKTGVMERLEQYYGPAISISPSLETEFSAADINVSKMGDVLQRDFPDLCQSDWDSVQLYFAGHGELPDNLGGYCTNMSGGLSTRLVSNVFNAAARAAVGAPKTPGQRWKQRQSDGRDILVAINMTNRGIEVDSPYVPKDQKLPLSWILAHELQHAVVMAARHRDYKDFLPQMDKHAAYVLGYLGSMASGVTVAGAGLLGIGGEVVSDTVLLSAGAGLSVAPILSALNGHIHSSRFGIPNPLPQPYADGEDAANAYAFVTQRDWAQVLPTDRV